MINVICLENWLSENFVNYAVWGSVSTQKVWQKKDKSGWFIWTIHFFLVWWL